MTQDTLPPRLTRHDPHTCVFCVAGMPRHYKYRETGNFTYVVCWPRHDIFKAGWTSQTRRWKRFEGRGAQVVEILEWPPHDPAAGAYEREILTLFEANARPAFASALEAEPFLGNGGGGYTECFYAPTGLFFVEGLLRAHRLDVA